MSEKEARAKIDHLVYNSIFGRQGIHLVLSDQEDMGILIMAYFLVWPCMGNNSFATLVYDMA